MRAGACRRGAVRNRGMAYASGYSTAILACLAWSCVLPQPMPSKCRELPDVDECQAVARKILDECLRDCVTIQCTGAKIRCDEIVSERCRKRKQEGAAVGGFVEPKGQNCHQPSTEINWCELPQSRDCRAKAMVHELAHSCGWQHGDGKGVPGNNGVMPCQ